MNAENPEALPEDATRVEVGDALFEGTRLLHEMVIRFEASADEQQWLRLIQELGFADRTVEDVRVAAFVALPVKPEQFSPFLVGEVTLSPDQPGTAQWSFRWARAPDASPPQEMLTLSEAVGGFPKVLDKLGQHWPTPMSLEAEVSVTYLLELAKWRLRLPSAWGDELQVGEQRLRVRPTHWKVEPPNDPVEEIILSQRVGPSVLLTAKGAYNLPWTPRFLNEVDGAVWGGLKSFLESR